MRLGSPVLYEFKDLLKSITGTGACSGYVKLHKKCNTHLKKAGWGSLTTGLTDYHAKYFAYDLTKQAPPGAADQLSMALFDASVDLNPHQIEAAMFALQSPLSEGAVLADEVGLGKTIEAGIVLCQKWAERKRRLIVICPASIRKQWATELSEKFNLPSVVIDARAYREHQAEGNGHPFEQKAIVIVSYNYAARMRDDLRMVGWELVVIDEAHKLRNAYRTSNKIGQALKWATEGRKKLLLTATPLQNSLMELYGLSTLIDDHIFGDPNAFRAKYMNADGDLAELRQRLSGFTKRTLRRHVLEYVRYTKRSAIIQPFRPTDDEDRLYNSISAFLQNDNTYAIPARQRHLTVLILRKLLASSSHAIAGTLDTLRDRLVAMRDGDEETESWTDQIITTEEIEDELLDEWLSEDQAPDNTVIKIDPRKLRQEIEEIESLARAARAIGTDTKTKALLIALNIGFEEQAKTGATRKALIFTESRRTQDYLKRFLDTHGYASQSVMFNGSNNDAESKAIYEAWAKANKDTGRSTGSRAIDIRTALIEHFRDHASIMIATEAAAEGLNLQFCSQVINYDLPWNPQRIEQRIGRCHRYGQQHDVIVINFLNERNSADQRVFQLLREKFNLFDGIFGASDEVLGAIESGVDFERRVLAIYQECRTPQTIEAAFKALQDELEDQIRSRIEDTRRTLLEHFDEDVHARLRIRLADAKAQLDQVGQNFWNITNLVLQDAASFDDKELAFDLTKPPSEDIKAGRYHLISRSGHAAQGESNPANDFGYYLYRLSHPLGEYVIDRAKGFAAPPAELCFNISKHAGKIAVVEALKGKGGYLTLNRLTVNSFETEEYLLFSGFDDKGQSIDHETCAKLFSVNAQVLPYGDIANSNEMRLFAEADQHVRATISKSLEANNKHFAIARERLEQWADDKQQALDKALKDTKELIKGVNREARQAETLEVQRNLQQRIQELERKKRKQRQEIFDLEDEIFAKRDELIAGLERRLSHGSATETLFTIRWTVQ